MVEPRRLLIRRIFKIWPAYYFLIFCHLVTRHHPIKSFFWQNVFHLQNYLGSSIAQTWTLSLEEHFYLALALLLGLAASRQWTASRILRVLATISALAFAARCITAFLGNYEGALRWTQNRVDSFLIGVITALLYHFMPEAYAKIAKRIWPLAAVSAIGVAFCLLVPERRFFHGPGYTVLYLSCASFLILVMEHSGRLIELWIYRMIAKIGIYSYGLYLWHSAMLGVGEKIISRYPARPAWFLALGVQFVGAMIIAFVTTRLIEWPVLYYRESIAWLRDSMPLIGAAGNPAKPSCGAGNPSPATSASAVAATPATS
jgi:peptidoglycan/LPS O-acetylase OafA/YrhL